MSRPVNLRAATTGESATAKYHVVKSGRAACGVLMPLGASISAHDVPRNRRCGKSLCARLFIGADEDALGVTVVPPNDPQAPLQPHDHPSAWRFRAANVGVPRPDGQSK